MSRAFNRRMSRLCPTPVWRPYIGPSPGSGTGCCRPMSAMPAALSAAAWRTLWRKMAAILNRWIRNRSRHNNQPFSGFPKASIRDEGLFFEKNTLVPDSSPHPVNNKVKGKYFTQLCKEDGQSTKLFTERIY
jgi:hypothetical protein